MVVERNRNDDLIRHFSGNGQAPRLPVLRLPHVPCTDSCRRLFLSGGRFHSMKRLSIILILVAGLLVPRPAQALAIDDLLSVVAMPLAVAAVADLAGVPADDLGAFVATLNAAAVPPAQVIEVVRYVPIALIDDGPDFVTYVRTQSLQVQGVPLINVVEQRLRTYDIEPQIVSNRTLWVDADYIPAPVRMVVTERRTHPHGGPPGQLKKERGLQTGAEVVHGDRVASREPRIKVNHDKSVKVEQHGQKPAKIKVKKERVVVQPGTSAPHGHGGGEGKHGKGAGHGNGNGGGKGHGKKG
jgi:hypothetical protein